MRDIIRMTIAWAILILFLLWVGVNISNPAPPYKIKPIPHG